MIEDTDAARAEMLVLAALTYRGFSDLLRGELHEGLVSQRVSEGLTNLPPVRSKWDLVWGPVTKRIGDEFDSSAMYVVRSRTAPGRYVVAVRGTNPMSLTDWLLGDLVVATTVTWPSRTMGRPSPPAPPSGCAHCSSSRGRHPAPRGTPPVRSN
jgi:hypothetical protein